MKYLIGILLFAFISCLKKKENTTNKNLIYFNSKFISELGNNDYEKLLAKTKLKIKAQYLDDLIFVTNFVGSNACGQYTGNIEIKNDSIILVYKLVSNEVCTSTSVEKLTYIISNPKEKKYKFSMRYE
ncbi:hypothetical protein [Flavobacterium sp. H122]|uniref:hypothetical protein n=1 Tax=Flavobacterium sp. H122 TaxID=2529860 RepID=UPI0010AA712F|nr:hypothetical protein [Flavobacterium sp. H122]